MLRSRSENYLIRKTKNAVLENKLVQTLERNREIDKTKEDRAKKNIFESVNLSKEEKLKRRIEDLSFTTILIRNHSENKDITNIPFEYKLYQNYPNPFNPATEIRYSVIGNGFVSLKIYDLLGKLVSTLVNEKQAAGIYSIEFNGSNLAGGVYYYQIHAGDFIETKRMLLLK